MKNYKLLFTALSIISTFLTSSSFGFATNQGPLVKIVDVHNDTVQVEMLDIIPSFLGSALFSLTKKPTDKLENIVWDGIKIRPIHYATYQIKELRVIGKPISYKFEKYANTIYFFPINVVSESEKSEEWYWQGEIVSGFRITESGDMIRVEIPIAQIKCIFFMHDKQQESSYNNSSLGVKVDIKDVHNDQYIVELDQIIPSAKGMTFFSLTKMPMKNLDSIVWIAISIREISKQIKEIQIIASPISFVHEGYQNPYYFYSIKVTPEFKNSGIWYWEGENIYGSRISKSGIKTDVKIPLNAIKTMSF